ncbi:hypothetical protein VB713_17330 [Anabaena cylindrica UHCC 0172]|uniref:hypothetical protein n=1 Tax=Anabaena cylindrica TaxID=1165 RepID=UPI002B1ECBC5|nr:hypothetical protein [Anabaena cylindrica]MEA5552708.1 hypothetical protein [Anabaena cylindrica UHCC 0172]
MDKNDFAVKLHLLVPWDLPIEQELNEVDKTKLYKALNQLLLALKQPGNIEALITINQALVNLEITDVITAEISSTETSLKTVEVEDFDNYFGVMHIESQEPAICLVRSLLLAYRNFLELSQNFDDFDPIYIEMQKRGFETYTYLLSRVFSLCLEEIS